MGRSRRQGARPELLPARATCMQAAARAIAKEWGRPPIYVREGGTVRVTTFLEKTLRSPAIHLPFGQSSDSPHLPNERIRLLNLVTGTRVLESFFAELAVLPPIPQAAADGAPPVPELHAGVLDSVDH